MEHLILADRQTQKSRDLASLTHPEYTENALHTLMPFFKSENACFLICKQNEVGSLFLSDSQSQGIASQAITSPGIPSHGIAYHRDKETHCFSINSKKVRGPLIFLHLPSASDNKLPQTSATSLTRVTVEGATPLTLVELYYHPAHFLGETTANAQFILQENATLKHVQIQKGSKKSKQILHTTVAQRATSHYQGAVFAFDLLSGTTLLDIHLQAAFSKAEVYALMALKQVEEGQLFLTTYHEKPDCESKVITRGLISDEAKGEFSGKIIVSEGAIQTRAKLENKNLLLSKQAEMTTRPFLEIYNDDVQCAHGATVGQLDGEALFYLNSRGIPEPMAKKMLLEAFIQPVLSEIPSVARPYLEECLRDDA